MSPSPSRFNVPQIVRQHRLAFAGLAALCCSSFAVVSIATAENPARYPYDPACAWGRLADGHGMLLRCLEPGEANALLDTEAKPSTQAGASRPASVGAVSGSAASGSAGSASPAGSAPPAAPSAAAPAAQPLSVSAAGPAVPDSGELPQADKKLGAPKDRYIECVTKNGGLTAPKGRVVLRFLVRERGRAEGIEVKSVSGMSRPAADCIADVVDRRYVGYPSAPIVGVTFPIELSQVR